MSGEHRIAVIPGDGIGVEVIPEAVAALQAVARLDGGMRLQLEELDWSSQRYLREGSFMPDDFEERLRGFDAILAGPCGDPRLPDAVVLWGFIIPLRQRFDQYVNLRPVRLLPGVDGRLRDVAADDLDIVFVRENTEGEYSGVGGRVHRALPEEVAIESLVFTRTGVERVVRFAFEYAREHGRRKVTSATKSNAQRHAMVFWDEVFAAVAAEYPDIEHESRLIDALAARMVTDPGSLDVVVASNLFGDILTDLGSALAGSLGIAPSANLDPTRRAPSLFQAIHGSAPDIAGRGIANPVAELWSAAMLLEFLGEVDGAAALMRAIEDALGDPAARTPDLGGSATTRGLGAAVLQRLGG
jgi:tartrate dehydrogenase/decarboxylase / D-malate dehydrogenase